VWTRAIADCPRESAFGRRRFCAYFSTKLGFLLLRRQDVPAARAAFDEALAFAPGYAPAHVGLGHLDLAAGDVLGARRHVAEATREGPPAPAVVELVDELRARIDESSPRPGPMVR
jgi:Flp pilus assembly protein TadD